MKLSDRLALIEKAGLSDGEHVVMTVGELKEGVRMAYLKGKASGKGRQLETSPVRR
jgi:hypothetical protein